MAPRFFGRFEHSLDAKGRVILPARFRSQFDTQAYLTQHSERCLALFTPDEFEHQVEEMQIRAQAGVDGRNFVRWWASHLTEIDLDRQGRLPIPSYLRDYARLDSNVLVIGALSHMELWSPAEYDARILPAEAPYADPPSAGGE